MLGSLDSVGRNILDECQGICIKTFLCGHLSMIDRTSLVDEVSLVVLYDKEIY